MYAFAPSLKRSAPQRRDGEADKQAIYQRFNEITAEAQAEHSRIQAEIDAAAEKFSSALDALEEQAYALGMDNELATMVPPSLPLFF